MALAAAAADIPYRTFQHRIERSNGYWEDKQFIITSTQLLRS